ncbi:MAG: hypothetical protein QW117_02430 [Candidatus Pacearchaeota archaeon]
MKKEEKIKNKEILKNTLKKFLTDCLKKYRKEIKAIWCVINKESEDILICVLLDNLKEKKEKIKNIQDWLLNYKFSLEIKIYSYLLTDYFERIMKNDFYIINEIKNSLVIYDPSSLINPLKILINLGRIGKSSDSLLHLIMDTGSKMTEIRRIKIDILSNIYSAVIDSAQAFLLLKGYTVIIPSSIPALLKNIEKRREITKIIISYFEDIFNTYKKYEHGEIKDISGKELDNLIKKADYFISYMQELAARL